MGMNLDADTLKLLKQVIERRKIPLYDLIEERASENEQIGKVFDQIVEMAYFLAGNGLIALEVVEGDEGKETILKPTPMGESYVKNETLRK
jgi:hypothetical protein